MSPRGDTREHENPVSRASAQCHYSFVTVGLSKNISNGLCFGHEPVRGFRCSRTLRALGHFQWRSGSPPEETRRPLQRGIYTPVVVLWNDLAAPPAQVAAHHAVRHLVPRPPAGRCCRIAAGCNGAAFRPLPAAIARAIQKLPKLVPQAVTQDIVQRLNPADREPWPGWRIRFYLVDGSTLSNAPHAQAGAGLSARSQSTWPDVTGPSCAYWCCMMLGGIALFPEWGPAFGDQVVSEQKLAAQAFVQVPPVPRILADRKLRSVFVAWEAHRWATRVVVG